MAGSFEDAEASVLARKRISKLAERMWSLSTRIASERWRLGDLMHEGYEKPGKILTAAESFANFVADHATVVRSYGGHADPQEALEELEGRALSRCLTLVRFVGNEAHRFPCLAAYVEAAEELRAAVCAYTREYEIGH